MKRANRKLSLARETLHRLEASRLAGAAGGGPPTTTQAPSNCNTHCASLCDPTCEICVTHNAACPPTWVGCEG